MQLNYDYKNIEILYSTQKQPYEINHTILENLATILSMIKEVNKEMNSAERMISNHKHFIDMFKDNDSYLNHARLKLVRLEKELYDKECVWMRLTETTKTYMECYGLEFEDRLDLKMDNRVSTYYVEDRKEKL